MALCLMLMAATWLKLPKWKTRWSTLLFTVRSSPSKQTLSLVSLTYRGREVVVGFLKVGYKKLFLLVS